MVIDRPTKANPKSITTPKPQCKHHASFRFLRHLPGHGLGHTRSRLARTASANRFVRASLHFFAATIPTLAHGCFTPHSSILSAGCNQRRKERKSTFTITLQPLKKPPFKPLRPS